MTGYQQPSVLSRDASEPEVTEVREVVWYVRTVFDERNSTPIWNL